MSVADIMLPTGKINPQFLPSSTPSDIITSPLTIESTDGTKSGTISIGNAPGDMTISVTEGDMFLNPDGDLYLFSGNNVSLSALNGGDIVILSSNQLKTANFKVDNTTGDLSITAENDVQLNVGSGTVLFDNGGVIGCEGVALGSNCEVTYGTTNLELVSSAGVFNVKNKSGATGVIYDTQFNPLPTPFTVTAISLASGQSGNISGRVFSPTVVAGLYQLQLTISNITPGSLFLQALVAQNSSTLQYSIITIPVTAVISGQSCTFTSGCFSLVAGDINCNIDTTGTNWSSTNWSAQLVRYA